MKCCKYGPAYCSRELLMAVNSFVIEASGRENKLMQILSDIDENLAAVPLLSLIVLCKHNTR